MSHPAPLRVRVLGESTATRAATHLLAGLGIVIDPQATDAVLGEAPLVEKWCAERERHGHPAPSLRVTLALDDDHLPVPAHAWETEASRRAGLYEPLLPLARPETFPFPVSSFLAGAYGVIALFAAALQKLRHGTSQEARVPLVDAGLISQGLQATFATQATARWSPVQWLASPFKELWPASDGRFFYLHVGLPKHLESFLACLEGSEFANEAKALRKAIHPQTLADPISVRSRREATRITRLLLSLFKSRPAAFWEDLLARSGLCCVVVRTFSEWCAHPQARLLHWDENRGTPQSPIRLSPSPLPSEPWTTSLRDTATAPLSGLRVLDFTQVIAGPLAGRTLAELGAEVIRIENPTSRQGFVEPFAAEYHVGKASRSFDLRSPDEREALWKLVAEWRPHVVLQNFGRGVAERIGISEAHFRQVVPGVVFLDLNAFGCAGPLADLPGFEQTAQALCGFCDDYARAGTARLFPLPINDIGAGVLGAAGVMAALWHQAIRGEGSRVHTSLAASATLLQWLGHLEAKPLERSVRRGPGLKKILRQRMSQKHPLVEMISSPGIGPMPVLRAPLYLQGIALPRLGQKSPAASPSPARRPSLRWAADQFLWGLWLVWRARTVAR